MSFYETLQQIFTASVEAAMIRFEGPVCDFKTNKCVTSLFLRSDICASKSNTTRNFMDLDKVYKLIF